MKRVALLLIAVLALLLAYLLFWPVPIEPVAWQAPPTPERGEPDADGPRRWPRPRKLGQGRGRRSGGCCRRQDAGRLYAGL